MLDYNHLTTMQPEDALATLDCYDKRERRSDYRCAALSKGGILRLSLKPLEGNSRWLKRLPKFPITGTPQQRRINRVHCKKCIALHNFSITSNPKYIKAYLYHRDILVKDAMRKHKVKRVKGWTLASQYNGSTYADYRVRKEDNYPVYHTDHLIAPLTKLLQKHSAFNTFTARQQEEMTLFLAHCVVSKDGASIPQNFMRYRVPTLVRQICDKTTGEVLTGYRWLIRFGYLKCTGYKMGYMVGNKRYVEGTCRRFKTLPRLQEIDLRAQQEMLENRTHTPTQYANSTHYYTKCGKRKRVTKQCKLAQQCEPIVLNLTEAIKVLNTLNTQETKGKYINDLRCLNFILQQATTFTHNGIEYLTYVPKYRVVSTGRIQEHGGGLQTISRITKTALYHKTGMVNKDIKGSQVMLLAATLKEHGFSSYKGVQAYMNKDRAKLAKQCLLPEKAFKRVLLSTIFGASLAIRHGRTFLEIIKPYHTTSESRKECLTRCKRVLRFLTVAINDYDAIYCNKTTHVNAMGTVTYGEYTAKTRAHYLQGAEAYIISKYPKASNEHDGYTHHSEESEELLRNIIKGFTSKSYKHHATNTKDMNTMRTMRTKRTMNTKRSTKRSTQRHTSTKRNTQRHTSTKRNMGSTQRSTQRQPETPTSLTRAMRQARITITHTLIFTGEHYHTDGRVTETISCPLSCS